MKLFKSLLVAPATLGLLAPMAATANEVTINDFNAAEELAVTNSRVDGLEARLNNFEAGSFSETTTASFSVDAVLSELSMVIQLLKQQHLIISSTLVYQQVSLEKILLI